ncbi:hypothetical protein BJ138DRAFT_1162354 [Hygrophoropsis aurantiaca]|uniref:Uncharacterized protein n=1 Tax=Hygrophoropsis aurantiaca TaxID=72124 RepID=A0ACB7ZZP8_9AGAM|nr:hypothetical protein BJ138DRAFT_1162354 [Hygrophoropsis aurantiaca]
MVVLPDKYFEEIDADRDAPPSYDTITPSNSRPPVTNEKSPQGPSASLNTSTSTHQQHISKIQGKQKASSASWFSLLPFTSSRTAKQVRQTVLSLVRDLVVLPTPASSEILDSCADACAANHLDLSAILQEPSIEEHTPMYWAIVNRRSDGDEVLASLLVHAGTAPLAAGTLSDIRLACLVTSNQKLFHALRTHKPPFDTLHHNPTMATRPGSDALVLGNNVSDDVQVREVDGDGAFVATLAVKMWQKRMRVAGRVGVEFIARGRIWSITFFSAPASTPTITGKAVGTWQVALSLLDHSPPTHIDSRLLIEAASTNESSSSTSASASPPPPTSPPPLVDLTSQSQSPTPGTYPPSPAPSAPRRTSFPSKFSASMSKSKGNPPLEVRLKTSSHARLACRSSSLFVSALDTAFGGGSDWTPPRVDMWAEEGVGYTNALVVPLGEGAGAGLLYDDTPYISSDGTLHARLEARLAKADNTDCIIC